MNTNRNYEIKESVTHDVIIKAKSLVVDDIFLGTLTRISEVVFNEHTAEEKKEPVFHFQLLEEFSYEGNALPTGTFISICNGAFKRAMNRLNVGSQYAIHWRGEKPNKGKPGHYHDWGINRIEYKNLNGPVNDMTDVTAVDFGEFGDE